MNKLSIAVISFLLLFAQLVFADAQPNSRVQIKPEHQGTLNAGQIEYIFKLFDSEQNKEVADQDLSESHTKKLHFIIYDAALKEFNHAHPTFNNNVWKAELVLPVNGSYFIWAQGELLDGTEFSAPIKLHLTNGQTENPKLPLVDTRTGSDNQTVLDLAKTRIRAGKMVMLGFKVTRKDGVEPVMTLYLGALAHVIATPADGDELIHVHPMDGDSPNTGMIHATFPKEGSYRLWVQFIEHDELKIIPLSVIVYK